MHFSSPFPPHRRESFGGAYPGALHVSEQIPEEGKFLIGGKKNTKPTIAILTVYDRKRKFRGNHKNFKDIIKTGEQLGCQVYVVTVRDLNLSADFIKGYKYSAERKEWLQGRYPPPNIVYNRIPLREDESRPLVQKKIKECIAHPKINLYNPYFFNKWELFEWLSKARSTVSFVPHTRKLKSSSVISSILQSHPTVYLKPESGKAGKGIMTLQYREEDKLPYKLKIQDQSKSTTYKSSNLESLWKKIKRSIKQNDYIIQQGIELAEYGGRPFDLRVLVQKNANGQWRMTGVGARLAGRRSITTHVPRGGSIEDPILLLSSVFDTQLASNILNDVKSTALEIARQIEKSSGHALGEMSMDLGIDQDGGIWFFEANSKPMKFDEPAIRKRSLERLIQYCTHLAKQNG
ncbi:YheC/YheD family protein [Paenibacillus urinalis]|uniref:YheC/YheD family endospore coat-associated protein n=1 Tax=Paenibacillus urinalis TaxID=521520 RepID=UPI0030835041